MSKNIWKPSFASQEMEIKTQKIGYQGFYRVSEYMLRHKKFNGEWSNWLNREQIQTANSVAALLIDPKKEVVIMVEQFRLGPLGQKGLSSPWLLEIVAGYQESNETPQEAIKREVQEEAHCEVQQLIPICEFYTSPGGLQERTSVYCTIVDSGQAKEIGGSEQEEEDIKIHIIPIDLVLEYLHNGLISSSSTIIALQWLEGNLNKLLKNYKNA